MTLAQSVAYAEIPLKKTNTLLTSMMKTFKTSIKYTLSYGAIDAFISGVRDAVSFAKDLNSSLNDIRIVSGQSADQMDRFAVQATKAAKELKASTLDYTKAALIYYQQGLNDEEVTKRTDTTVKMANVLGETASQVSDYMTAIWNNFDMVANHLNIMVMLLQHQVPQQLQVQKKLQLVQVNLPQLLILLD